MSKKKKKATAAGADCTNCGATNLADYTFCFHCRVPSKGGGAVKKKTSAPPPVPPSAPPVFVAPDGSVRRNDLGDRIDPVTPPAPPLRAKAKAKPPLQAKAKAKAKKSVSRKK